MAWESFCELDASAQYSWRDSQRSIPVCSLSSFNAQSVVVVRRSPYASARACSRNSFLCSPLPENSLVPSLLGDDSIGCRGKSTPNIAGRDTKQLSYPCFRPGTVHALQRQVQIYSRQILAPSCNRLNLS